MAEQLRRQTRDSNKYWINYDDEHSFLSQCYDKFGHIGFSLKVSGDVNIYSSMTTNVTVICADDHQCTGGWKCDNIQTVITAPPTNAHDVLLFEYYAIILNFYWLQAWSVTKISQQIVNKNY
eukprot:UN09358